MNTNVISLGIEIACTLYIAWFLSINCHFNDSFVFREIYAKRTENMQNVYILMLVKKLNYLLFD